MGRKGEVILRGESPPVEEHVPESDPIISIQGVSKRFGSHVVLEDISFDVPRGETSAILGPPVRGSRFS